MIEVATGLASDPENVAIVACIVLGAILLQVLTRDVSRNVRFWANIVASVLVVVAVMVWGAYKAPRPSEALLAKDMRSIDLTRAGASVQLIEVESIKGWGEGPNGPINGGTVLEHGHHEFDAERDAAALIFDHILRDMGLGGITGARIVAMDQDAWVDFLQRLGPRGRREISSIPFATVVLRASDGHERRVILFAHDAAQVRDRFGNVEVTVCALRIFNIRESATRGAEAILLGIGSRGCRNRGETGIELAKGRAR